MTTQKSGRYDLCDFQAECVCSATGQNGPGDEYSSPYGSHSNIAISDTYHDGSRTFLWVLLTVGPAKLHVDMIQKKK